jgi:hypothetical protein
MLRPGECLAGEEAEEDMRELHVVLLSESNLEGILKYKETLKRMIQHQK